MQAFEGLKAVRHSNDTVTIFRPEFHHRRLAHSANTIALPAPPLETFLDALNLLVRSNAHLLGPADSSAVLYISPLLIPTLPDEVDVDAAKDDAKAEAEELQAGGVAP
ncbi:hypothetical protein B5807_03236 [Epicoccum nigrum]|uniref:Branched-chain amino acid aminotransferase n=1 Tax=Epicoccum nigrum TaxID=105696 RepID=A0A1Y2M652_EPING|nr:hypothetical protein B5807_03236 [Epicoccum nigrum]